AITYLMGLDGAFKAFFTVGADADEIAAKIKEHL
ncbi:MAG: SCO family protein, partial [Rhodospirillales bacterium]|nr:SCO family protein [Rhodospirillales bacterium]